MCESIVMKEIINSISDPCSEELKNSTEQQNEMKSVLAVHARRDLAVHVGAKKYNKLYEKILYKSKLLQINAALKGELFLELTELIETLVTKQQELAEVQINAATENLGQ